MIQGTIFVSHRTGCARRGCAGVEFRTTGVVWADDDMSQRRGSACAVAHENKKDDLHDEWKLGRARRSTFRDKRIRVSRSEQKTSSSASRSKP
jgi:hypothetical protein